MPPAVVPRAAPAMEGAELVAVAIDRRPAGGDLLADRLRAHGAGPVLVERPDIGRAPRAPEARRGRRHPWGRGWAWVEHQAGPPEQRLSVAVPARYPDGQPFNHPLS